jgi:hypothetical protein
MLTLSDILKNNFIFIRNIKNTTNDVVYYPQQVYN